MRALCLSILAAMVLPGTYAEGREVLSFNHGWRFARFGALPDGSMQQEPAGLEKPAADDTGWRLLNLPHDWGIEGPFRAELPNRTGKLPWAGIGWYRKHFDSPETDRGQRIFIEFDGAMSDSSVWLNGQYIGGWPYGYSSFQLELTDHLRVGQENVIAVRLDNKPNSSRWYPGGGIYRNVRLVKTAPVHVAHWGTFVTTPNVSADAATVHIETRIKGPASGVKIQHRIMREGSSKVLASGSGTNCSITLANPELWDLDHPHLYRVRTSVVVSGSEVDTYATVFGVRSIKFTADKGFLLNGHVLKMNGVCQHHDLGPLGTAINIRALERQIEILQSMGCNAIRTSHNPPAPELLDLCDRMGMLVMVEAFDCWRAGKTPNDYSRFFPTWHEKDLRAMVRRDRNHPCVVMWSIGNEVREQGSTAGHEIARQLAEIVRSEDTTRPVTAGCNNARAGTNGFQKTVDVFGYNYKPHLYQEFRKQNPTLPLFGSETASCISSRGEYFFPVSDDKSQGCGGHFQVSSYDLYAPPWAYRPDIEFEAQDRNPWVFGEFVWTGFDYIGEPTPYNNDKTNLLNFSDPAERKRMAEQLQKLGGNVPSRSSYFGIVDLCGFPKDRYFLYQSRWRPELPMAHILPHWNWPERVGQVTPVHVYTSGDEAELFLNGKSLGRKEKGKYEYRLRWDDVVYKPGTLKVVAYKSGKPWAEDVEQTTGGPVAVRLRADRTELKADGQDLSFVTVSLADATGVQVPNANNRVHFELTGPGSIVAVGNGDATCLDSFQSSNVRLFNGLALAVVKTKRGAGGDLVLRARSAGMASAEIRLQSK